MNQNHHFSKNDNCQQFYDPKKLEKVILTTNNIINNVKIFPNGHVLMLLL